MFIFLFMIILCFTEQQSWRLCPHSLWQVWPPWPWPWPPSAPPSIFFSKWRFSHLQAPAAAATLLLDPTRLRAPAWQLQPRGVHVPLFVDEGPEVGGQWSLLGLGGQRQKSGDFEGNCKSSIKNWNRGVVWGWWCRRRIKWWQGGGRGEDEDDKDMELFYFTTELDARLCSVKKESCCSKSQLVTWFSDY